MKNIMGGRLCVSECVWVCVGECVWVSVGVGRRVGGNGVKSEHGISLPIRKCLSN